MPTRRYRCTWDDIAGLDADHMSGWGAFDPGRRETIDFDDDDLPKLAFEMETDRDEFSAVYYWRNKGEEGGGEFIRCRVALEKRRCRFGGWRRYFICPCCGGRVLRLAVLPEGLRCGSCGRVTWGSRRQRPLQRLIRKADKLSVRLGCDSWRDHQCERPLHMRTTTFERLVAERRSLVAEINRRIGARLARSSGLMGALGTMCKLGL